LTFVVPCTTPVKVRAVGVTLRKAVATGCYSTAPASTGLLPLRKLPKKSVDGARE
jgi:hypothetical protein